MLHSVYLLLFLTTVSPVLGKDTLHEQCDQHVPTNISVDSLPQLHGTWVSDRCEVRPGPVYVLRRFKINWNRFNFSIYHYSNESCRTPLHTLTIQGYISPNETFFGGAADTHVLLERAFIVPYTANRAEELSKMVSSECPGFVTNVWRDLQEYDLVKNEAMSSSCIPVVANYLTELSLIKTQVFYEDDKSYNELLTKNYASKKSGGVDFLPLFNPALYNPQQHPACEGCKLINEATENHPPIFPQSTDKTLHNILGKWRSTQCEIDSSGNHETRQLKLSSNLAWEMNITQYSDSMCAEIEFVTVLKGVYKNELKGKMASAGKAVPFGFIITEAHFSTELGDWKDVDTTREFIVLRSPTPLFTTAKIEIIKGAPVLLLGRNTTAFGYPLTQCRKWNSSSSKQNDDDLFCIYAFLQTSAVGLLLCTIGLMLLRLYSLVKKKKTVYLVKLTKKTVVTMNKPSMGEPY